MNGGGEIPAHTKIKQNDAIRKAFTKNRRVVVRGGGGGGSAFSHMAVVAEMSQTTSIRTASTQRVCIAPPQAGLWKTRARYGVYNQEMKEGQGETDVLLEFLHHPQLPHHLRFVHATSITRSSTPLTAGKI